MFLSGTLDNAGTITQTTPGASFNTLFFGQRLHTEQQRAVRHPGEQHRADHQRRQRLGLSVNNFGTFQKSGGTGTSTLGSLPFDNAPSGTVNVFSGTLALSGGGTDKGGTFTVASGTTLDLTGGSSPTLTGTYTGSGAGTVALANGTLNIGSGGATFNFPQNLFQWTGGTINASCRGPDQQSGQRFHHPQRAPTTLILNGTLNNAGTITQTTPGTSFNTLFFDSGAMLNNTGLFDIQENNTALTTNGGGGGAFNNLGTLQSRPAAAPAPWAACPSTMLLAVVVNVVTAGTLALSGGGTDKGGTFTVASGTDAGPYRRIRPNADRHLHGLGRRHRGFGQRQVAQHRQRRGHALLSRRTSSSGRAAPSATGTNFADQPGG